LSLPFHSKANSKSLLWSWLSRWTSNW
jgi:hypothetical protein